MKRQLFTLLTVALIAGMANAQDQKPQSLQIPAKPPEPKTDFSKIFKNDREKIGYAIGMYAASVKDKLKSQDIDYDTDMLIKGFADNVGAGPSLLTQEQKAEVLRGLNEDMRAKADAKRKEASEKNKLEGTAFLEKNKKESGVITLPDGLQYKVLTNGTGPLPKADEEVSVNYRGKLIDGTEFDDSFKRGQPFKTRVQGGVIKGWTEALQLMPAGSSWRLFIPSELAYGPNGRPPIIGPNAVLVFDLDLLEVKPAAPVAAAHPTQPLTSDIIKVPSADEIKKGAKIETIKAEDLDKEKAKTNQ